MKKLLLYLLPLAGPALLAQNYTPIATSGYNMDGVAESSPATGSTSGAIDANDYVLYSVAYATVFSSSAGLPNNGAITNSGSSYQLKPYNANNILHVVYGQADSLIVTTPASYNGLSLLGFATEGSADINIIVRYTDGTNESFMFQTLPDWFYNPNPVISGFDRTSRSSNYPDFQSGEPRMYAVNLNLNCANRSKNVAKLVIENTSPGVYACVLALSGVSAPTYSTSTVNACFGTPSGKASAIVSGGLPPYSYTWTSNPVQHASTATNLPAGTYTVTISDASGCTNTLAATVSQPTAALTTTIAASSPSLCAGSNATLTTSSATSYTWSNGASTSSTVISPTISTTYSVTGTAPSGCPVTGSINISVNPKPIITFSLAQTVFCSNSPSVALNASPTGGVYAGSGVAGPGNFSPATAGTGTQTISYSYTNTANGCSATAMVSVTVNAAPAVSFSISPNQFCINSLAIALNGAPTGGSFTGTGMTGTAFIPSQAGIGTHTITYSYTNSSNCTASASSTATVSACTGIEELEIRLLTVYPNPGKGVFNIHTIADLQVTILSQAGQVVSSKALKAGDTILDLSGFAAGVYFISGQNDQQMIKQKIVILD